MRGFLLFLHTVGGQNLAPVVDHPRAGFLKLRSECAKGRDAQSVSWDITKTGEGCQWQSQQKDVCLQGPVKEICWFPSFHQTIPDKQLEQVF